MYKTVRQGDASLQYTILPQVDQFYVNEMSSITGPPTGSPVKGAHRCCPLEKRSRVKTARTVCFTVLIVAMFVCCAIGAYLIDEMVSRRCAVTNFKATAPLTNEYSGTSGRDTKNEIQESKDSARTTVTTTARPSDTRGVSGALADKETSGLLSRISTSSSTVSDGEPSNFDFTMSETSSPSTSTETHSTLSSSMEAGRTASALPFPSPSDVSGSSLSEDSPDSRASIISAAPTNSIVNILRKLKMLKSSRVTLKLTRITDTVPQMYLKAGIASYKKGKITTSVLAQGLTLEGLIFKRPDGTINPWREKWPFDQEEDTDDFPQKRTFARDLTALGLLVGIVVMLILLVMVLRLVRSAIERWQKVTDIRKENRDEAHSTLLDTQIQDPEDKE